MNIQVIDNELQLLGLKNKLQTNLKYYLLGSSKPYILLDNVIKLLKIKYDENMVTINDLDKLKQNIDKYSFGFELLKVEDWIVNWTNT